MDMSESNGAGHQPNHHHHHEHHNRKEKHVDASELFKRSSLSAQKKRRIISNVLFAVLTILAIGIVAACVLVNYI